MAERKQLKSEQLISELEKVRKLSKDGLLHPEKALAWARNNKGSALYKEIEWDDSKAAEAYRIEQVRNIIRVVVLPSEEVEEQKVRVYVSLPSDRVHGGGYRETRQALIKARQEMIDEALNTVLTLHVRFNHLPELSPLFEQIEEVVKGYRKGGRRVS